ncbi:GNAT family N-acetyltransferase [Pelagibacterium xiamenense]|uniref:GNAT family N-acetyltransferase n=1 Tax=Pelagibacterium xiamenense TaxID=2901140 RepID=UPI001E5FF449|nr:GNAT family N-acetyltransferase [Pelagibacterium xiamenense]MCD7061156.1 GNAT family N-acetyltransferase [Pelagibacterium xiamenense]
MAITIAIETPLQDDVRALVKALNAYLNPLSPPEFQFQMTVEQMAGEDTTLFIARDDSGRAVGMGALKVFDGDMAEIKRMYTLPEVRGQRVGVVLLEAIEALAREKGIRILKLETGSVAGFEPAWRLYERGGFARCGAFLDYPDSEYSAFYEKALV